MKVKVFHPYFQSSIFCKEILKKFDENNVEVYQKNQFDKKEEMTKISSDDEIVIVFPIWWYTAPFNFVKWCEMMGDQKEYFANKSIKIIAMVGGAKERYDEFHPNAIELMNSWITKYFGNVAWEIYYGCVPPNIEKLKKQWFGKGE